MKNCTLPLAGMLAALLFVSSAYAQTCCTPAVTTGGMYIYDIYYGTLATGGTDQNNGVNAALVFATSATSLPVQFISINAYQQSNGNELQWKVGTEENLATYHIERSADGSSVQAIGLPGTVAAGMYRLQVGNAKAAFGVSLIVK